MAATSGALRPSGFFVLRTPLLSFDEFLRWSDARQSDGRDRQAGLLDILGRPEVLDALYLASPSLVDALADPGGRRGRRALPGLASYFARMCSRVTPFGLFAGLGVGHLGPTTSLDVPDASGCHRHTRLDVGYLSTLVAALEGDPEVRRLLTWWPNTSILRAGGRVHVAAGEVAAGRRSYRLVAVEETEALAASLERAGPGATPEELAAFLVANGAARPQAEDFVDRLIEAQLLVSELEVHVTGDDPVDSLIATLAAHPHTARTARCLDEVRTALADIDARGPGATPAEYRRVQALLAALPVAPEDGRLFQVDMTKPSPTPSLGPAPLAEIARVVDILGRLARPPRPDSPLARFRDALVDRYDDMEVPLLEALDPEVGIGFGAVAEPGADLPPILEGLDVVPPTAGEDGSFGAREAALLGMLLAAVERGETEIRLDDADLVALASPEPPPLPDCVEVIVVLAAASAEAIDRGEFRVLVRGMLGPPGVSVLGRFCHADPHLAGHVRAQLAAEEACRPDAAYAEVVHLPQGRAGNILCRPVLRPYEIPYLGRSGAPNDARLPPSDLTVGVDGGRVVLRSRRLGREVVPRLTAAHDFSSGSIGVYHLLCALADQETAPRFGWDWGPLVAAPFLPRVTHGRLVLARAQWRLAAAELADVARLRVGGRLPRFVAIADGDNDLVTDLDDELSVDALRRHTAGRADVSVMELFPGPDELCSTGPTGRFTHDLVVPFVRDPAAGPAPTAPGPRPARNRPAPRRRFPPGSEWFYAKLYTGPGLAERVLADLVRPLVDDAMARGLADRWFFVRYADPAWHLRLRIHGDPAELLSGLHALGAPLLDDGRMWRVQVDTYEPETGRYGGDEGIALSERVFHADSEAVLDLCARFGGDAGQDARWRLAVLGIDLLLSDLGFDLAAKEAWAGRQRLAYARELRVSRRLQGQLGDLHRAHRRSVADLLGGGAAADHPLSVGIAILGRRSAAMEPLARELGERGMDLSSLAASYAHMHVNRLLRSAHRPQELVVYDLLHRYYAAQVAIARGYPAR